jgi:DNA-binding MarR family transcriptional regulator
VPHRLAGLHVLDPVLYMHHLNIMDTRTLSPERQALLREVQDTCLIARTRLISRVITNIFDEELRPLGLQSSQHTLLGSIMRMGSATRAEISRASHIDRSTLTRNLQVMMDAGWIEEVADQAHGRQRPLRLSQAGEDLLFSSTAAWRAGQARAAEVLGQAGVSAIKTIADGILRS